MGTFEADAVEVQVRPTLAEQVGSTEDDNEKGLDLCISGVEEENPTGAAVATENDVAGIEAAQAVWGKRGRYLVIAG